MDGGNVPGQAQGLDLVLAHLSTKELWEDVGFARCLAVTPCARQCLVENTPRDHIGRRYGLDDFAGREDSSQSEGCVSLLHAGVHNLHAPQCVSAFGEDPCCGTTSSSGLLATRGPRTSGR